MATKKKYNKNKTKLPKWFSPFSPPSKPFEPKKNYIDFEVIKEFELCPPVPKDDIIKIFCNKDYDYVDVVNNDYDHVYEIKFQLLKEKEIPNKNYNKQLKTYKAKYEEYKIRRSEWKKYKKIYDKEKKRETEEREFNIYERLKKKFKE